MKIISLNIGLWVSNTSKIIDFLKKEDADIICLQEVSRLIESSAKKEFKVWEAIKKELELTHNHQFFGPLFKTSKINATGKTEFNFEGLIEQGNCILSKNPFSYQKNNFFHREFEHMTDWSSWAKKDHPRAFQHVVIDVDKTLKLQVIHLHGIWTKDKMGDERTRNEITSVINATSKFPNLPTIILGDINLLPESESLKLLDEQFTNLISKYKIITTRPHLEKGNIDKGNVVVDYIFINKLVEDMGFSVPNIDISDHLPLILEFDLRN